MSPATAARAGVFGEVIPEAWVLYAGIAISAMALKNRMAMLPDTNLKNKFVKELFPVPSNMISSFSKLPINRTQLATVKENKIRVGFCFSFILSFFSYNILPLGNMSRHSDPKGLGNH
jgi:hypothetical protein